MFTQQNLTDWMTGASYNFSLVSPPSDVTLFCTFGLFTAAGAPIQFDNMDPGTLPEVVIGVGASQHAGGSPTSFQAFGDEQMLTGATINGDVGVRAEAWYRSVKLLLLCLKDMIEQCHTKGCVSMTVRFTCLLHRTFCCSSFITEL